MGFVANIFGYVLNYIYNLVQNYGLALLLFTLVLKLILLPLTIKQEKSTKASQKMQKELNALKFKYKNDAEKLNAATIELYKREKFSPFTGCITAILQFVIILGVFYLVSQPLTYMRKVDSNLIKQYSQELEQSNVKSSYREIAIISYKGNEDSRVYLNMNFLGLDLTKVPMQNLKDPKVYIIPVLYIITMFVNIKINIRLMKTKEQLDKEKEEKAKKKLEATNKDDENKDDEKFDAEVVADELPDMQSMTKSMNYMMPIMSIFIGIIAPLGLSLYWLLSNVLNTVERLAISKIFSKKEEA